MITAEQYTDCTTCETTSVLSKQYKAVNTYTPSRVVTTTPQNRAKGEFRQIEASGKKSRMRKLNKLVSKWR